VPDRPDVAPFPQAARVPTSHTTHLAWLGGLSVAVTGLGLAGGSGPRPAGLLLLLSGTGVATAGRSARVSYLEVTASGLRIERAHRRPWVVSWADVEEVVAPRLPAFAWRIRASSEGPNRAIGLMPSDLLGRERVLEALIRRAELAGAGRRWVRASAVSPRR
jgi:hypothetical protein